MESFYAATIDNPSVIEKFNLPKLSRDRFGEGYFW